MSSAVLERWSLPEVELKPALHLALELEHTSMGVLMLRDEEAGTLELAVSEGLTPEQSSYFRNEQPGVGPVGTACAHRRRVTIPDATSDGNGFGVAVRDQARAVGFRGLDVVPLSLTDGTALGAVALLFPRVLRPRARVARLAEQCGHLLALALHNARLRSEAEGRCCSAEGAARSRVQFVARMSHELRTPLQSITGYIDLLRTGLPGPLTPRQMEVLDRVGRSERILLSVVDDLVSLARLEARRVDYKLQAVVARDVVTTAEAIVAPLAQRLGVRLDVVVPDGDLVARADERKTAQILVNLLTNAVKFSSNSEGIVRVGCRCDDLRIYFDVTDNGPGIPREKLAVIFDPYVQLGHRVPAGLQGIGLGLTISQEFAKAMGGAVTAKSKPTRGSTFTLQLRRYVTHGR